MASALEQLKELANNRRHLADLLSKSNDNSHKIIAEQLYDKQAHFIFELLQNAEDENATEAHFDLTDNELVFKHNGNPFTFNDIKSVSNFGDNNLKKLKANAIGRFGIGFKSVYAITSSPQIQSGDFHIEIKDYIVPSILSTPEPSKETKIKLPFNHKEKAKESTFDLLKEELKSFGPSHLLFLKHLKSITINLNGSIIHLDKKTIREKTKSKSLQVERIKLFENHKVLEFLVAKRAITFENKSLEVQLAFNLTGTGKKRAITKLNSSPLYVYFPTGKETNLSFLMHAPFATTPARDNILDGEEGNKRLQEAAAQLFADLLPELKEMNLINATLLNNFPVNKEECSRSEIYKHFYNALKNVLLSKNELIPLTNGGFASANDVLLTGSADLAELLSPAQAKKLFGRKYWIDKNITENKTKVLRDFFNRDLNVPEPDFTKFANELTTEFLSAQTDKWMVEFYKTIHKSRLQWKDTPKQKNNAAWILRNKAIIRDEFNNQVVPFSNTGKPNIYLPTKDRSDYLTIKKRISAVKEALNFFEELGLTAPKLLDEVNEFVIPKFENAEPKYYTSKEYLEDLIKIVTAYEKAPSDKKTILIQDLKATSFLLVQDSYSKDYALTIPALSYLPDPLLISYFEHSSVDFVAKEILELELSHKLNIRSFLTDLGVSSVPRRLPFKANFSNEEKKRLRSAYDGCTWDKDPIDYSLDGLNDIFESGITFEKSIIIWELLCNSLKSYTGWNKEHFFKGIYVYKYYGEKYIYFDAAFFNLLHETAWLITDQGELKAPKDTTLEELPADYKNELDITSTLANLLGFKLDEVKIFEEKTGCKVLSKDEVKEYEELKKFKQEWDEKQANTNKDSYKFEPEIEAGTNVEAAIPLSEDFLESTFTLPNNSSSADGSTIKSEDLGEDSEYPSNDEEDIDDVDINISAKTLKEIGNWGEKDVEQMLIVEFAGHSGVEIINLNKKGTGRGYDFIVKENGEIIRYVEVKTSVGSITQKHIISGTQWESARQLHDNGEGDLYWVYCIFNAGKPTKHTKIIKNPIKLWHEGKIIADPINFVVNLKKGAVISENL
ncbi:DUF3883 domain-containing protein [Pontibacter sp. FD36]|uniref:sacsin N-terminal ATP-binding-like domain-containing protein n=1 Tax=Pontibacter sp. FD36 TaxID=2789860 RepID=UPI0018AB1BF6|nr:DUF3883 domain-containing protein [Pontibacter sp. FD36]MBF8962949.1 DUF3883 domain-containing protein [Pontibacter sp. FD36]